MGQKHNRRRTRPRTRRRVNPLASQRYQSAVFINPNGSSFPFNVANLNNNDSYGIPSDALLYALHDWDTVPLAQHWQNRYMVYQSREYRQLQEVAKLEAEQCRLFGGEPGDDVTLCYRMLEYFGGLDFIDP